MDVLWGITLFLFGSLVPGCVVASVVVDRRDSLALVTLGTVLGVFVLPLLSFSLAVLIRTNLGPGLILSVGLLVTLLALSYSLRARQLRASGQSDQPE